MTGKMTDDQFDQFVKARWLALGLSQQDLAEVLGGKTDGSAMDGVDAGRLRQVADALGISPGPLKTQSATPGQRKAASCAGDEALQSLLELRLLRVFRELRGYEAKRMLVELTEQIARRQPARPEDAG